MWIMVVIRHVQADEYTHIRNNRGSVVNEPLVLWISSITKSTQLIFNYYFAMTSKSNRKYRHFGRCLMTL